MMVGATARIIMMEHVWGMAPGRGTRDVDFAVLVPRWEDFDRLKEILQESYGYTASQEVIHRLTSASHEDGMETVDLIPFGEIESPTGSISWPPGFAQVMCVTGYREALENAESVAMTHGGPTIKVASLAGMAILKLLAWRDREKTANLSKDALDLKSLLEEYEFACGDRIFDEVPTDQQILFEFDPKLSGAWLLGKDAARIAESRTSDEISSILSGQALERLVSTMMLTTANVDEEHVRCSKLLYGFRSGFLAA